MKPIVVVGSINLDLIVQAPRHPSPGETLLGNNFAMLCGGKGANQAIAAARFGSEVYMLGCVGDDEHAKILLNNLSKNKVKTKHVMSIENTSSGVAIITTAKGENTIIVNPGANACLSSEIIKAKESIIANVEMVVLQQEIPLDTVSYVLVLCKKHNVSCILNPAPACSLSQEVIDSVNYITPNEHECKISFNNENQSKLKLLEKYSNKLIVTEGSKGIVYHNGEKEIRVPAHKIDLLDSTGAGDSFNGVFASTIAQNYSLENAIKYANAAAALSTTKAGAQTSPYKAEVDAFLAF